MLYVLLAILLFGVLIIIHELGHFLTARLFNVTVNEFSIGMGPKILSKKSSKSRTVYSLRLFPIGGYVSMEGEDEESESDGAFCKKPVWQRMIITAAGSASNLLIGIIVMTILCSSTQLVSNTIGEFQENAVSIEFLEIGDEIVKIGNINTYTANDVVYGVNRYGKVPTEIIVLRNGERIATTVMFDTVIQNGHVFGKVDFLLYTEDSLKDGGLFTILKHSLAQSRLMIRMVVDSLYDLITGEYGINDMSGPVGITEVVSNAAKEDNGSVWFYFVLIAMNLGVMNMLPFPALDGGRIFFMIIELIARKPIPQKIEAIIHFIGMSLLLLLMVFITFKDIIKLIS